MTNVPKIRIRVVKPKTTAEELDEYYVANGFDSGRYRRLYDGGARRKLPKRPKTNKVPGTR